jgi:hypothetical protein
MSQFRIANSLTLAAVLCSFAAVPACTAAAPPPAPDGTLTLTAQFPADVTINKMPPVTPGAKTAETVKLTLTNSGAAPVTLQRPNDCQSHTWTVSDSSGQTIDDLSICPMIFMPVTLTIAAHGSSTGTEPVKIDNSKYQDGGHYTLHYAFWGISADAPFTVHVVQ